MPPHSTRKPTDFWTDNANGAFDPKLGLAQRLLRLQDYKGPNYQLIIRSPLQGALVQQHLLCYLNPNEESANHVKNCTRSSPHCWTKMTRLTEETTWSICSSHAKESSASFPGKVVTTSSALPDSRFITLKR